MSEGGKDPPHIQKRRDSERKERERQQHEDHVKIVGALNRVADELVATENQNKTSDAKKGFREYLTIFLV
jgi:ribosomal protein L32